MAALPPDVFTSIPPGISRAATPPFAGGPRPMPPPTGMGGMQTAPPFDPSALAQLGSQEAQLQPDLFQRVAILLMQDPRWVYIMAGLGLSEALEKSGKYESKPHRSNQELASRGMDVGNVGQTGFTPPQEMIRQLSPPLPARGIV